MCMCYISVLSSLYFARSSGFEDELCWAATWLYRATSDTMYMDYATEYYFDGIIWAFGWDNKYPGAQVCFRTNA